MASTMRYEEADDILTIMILARWSRWRHPQRESADELKEAEELGLMLLGLIQLIETD